MFPLSLPQTCRRGARPSISQVFLCIGSLFACVLLAEMVFSFRFPIRFVSGCCLFHPPLLAWIAFERMPFQKGTA